MKLWAYPDISEHLSEIDMQPPIICLCGSTRFKDEFMRQNADLSLKGYIILSVGFFHHEERYPLLDNDKRKLDFLHKRKIDICDEVYILNVNGYIGSSTESEIVYAIGSGKLVRYLENKD